MKGQAFVELSADEVPVRIFGSAFAAFTFHGRVILMSKREAISAIRLQIWHRTHGVCDWCSKPISEQSMHMHEMIPRGEGGEISLSNSVGICYDCHFGPAGHGHRVTRFGEEG